MSWEFTAADIAECPFIDKEIRILAGAEMFADVPLVTRVTSISGLPPTTALRWLREFEARGLIEKQADENDKRRTLIVLTDAGKERLQEVLDWLNGGV